MSTKDKITFICAFISIFAGAGIAGNIELNEKVYLSEIVIYLLTTFYVMGRIIYVHKNEK